MAGTLTHIDINQEIRDWESAQYGREVRAANVGALTKLQDQANGAIDYIAEKGVEIDGAVTEVRTVSQEARDAVEHAEQISADNKKYTDDTVAEYRQYADDKLSETERQRQEAQAARQGAEDAAELSRSWAVGGTGSRPGESGDNSRYYAEKSREHADRSSQEADRAAQYSQVVAPGFYVDLEAMELYIKTGVGVDFKVADDNILCWKIA